MKIVTHYAPTPIPLRQFDWVAYQDGEEESMNYGYGATELEAINNFKQLMEDME